MISSNSHHKKKKRKSSHKGPGLFPDIGKEAKDLLTKGYIKDDVFSISTRRSIGVVPTLTTVVRKGRHSTSNIAASYTYKNSSVDLKFDSKSHLPTLAFSGNFWSSTKTIFTLKLPDYSSSELKFEYFHENAALASSLVLNRSPKVKISAVTGNPRIAFGVEAEYKTTGCFTKYDAGIHVANTKCSASMILANKGDLLKASYVHHFDQSPKITMGAEMTRKFSTKENTLTVGGSCEVDPMTVLKVKINNHGKLNTLLLHRIRTKSSLSISGEFDTKALDNTPRIGLGAAIML